MPLVKEIKNWMLPQETAIPYRILTGLTKSAEIATILIGLGATGISVLTRVLNASVAYAGIAIWMAGTLGANKMVDITATTNNRTRREKQNIAATQIPTQSSHSSH